MNILKEIIKYAQMIRIPSSCPSSSTDVFLLENLIKSKIWQNHLTLFKIVKQSINIKYENVLISREHTNMSNFIFEKFSEVNSNYMNSPRTNKKIEKKRFAFCEFTEILTLFLEIGLNGKVIDELIKIAGKKYDFTIEKIRDFLSENFYHSISPKKSYIEAMKIKQEKFNKISCSVKYIFILKKAIYFFDPNEITKLNYFSFIPGNILKKTVYKSFNQKCSSSKDFVLHWASYYNISLKQEESKEVNVIEENKKLAEEIKIDVER